MNQTKNTIGFNSNLIFKNSFSDKSKESFYTEFYSLLQSGVDIQRCLQLLHDEEEKSNIKEIIAEASKNLIKGFSLSESLKNTGFFVPYEYQSIKIGEETGKLKEVLQHLTKYYGDKIKLKRQLVSVFTYPVFVLFITIGVLYFMLVKVVPMFDDVFKQFGQELPFLTRQIINLSKYFSLLLISVVVIIITILSVLYYYKNDKRFRSVSSKIVMNIPVFGPMITKIYLTRFCQSLSLLLSAKTPLLQSLELTENMISFYPLEDAISQMKQSIRKGEMLHTVMSRHSIFTKKMVSLTKIAEEINQLDKTFDRLGEKYQEEVEFQTKLIGTIMEPAIIILIGGIVGVIMVAMYLPMFELSNVVK